MTEEQLHKQICDYIRLQYPRVVFNTDLSGVKLTIGQAKKIKSLRRFRGIPDIQILEPVGAFHGLFLEVKKESPFKKDGGLKKDEHLSEQQGMIRHLESKGYFATFVWSFEDAKNTIDGYMKGVICQLDLSA